MSSMWAEKWLGGGARALEERSQVREVKALHRWSGGDCSHQVQDRSLVEEGLRKPSGIMERTGLGSTDCFRGTAIFVGGWWQVLQSWSNRELSGSAWDQRGRSHHRPGGIRGMGKKGSISWSNDIRVEQKDEGNLQVRDGGCTELTSKLVWYSSCAVEGSWSWGREREGSGNGIYRDRWSFATLGVGSSSE